MNKSSIRFIVVVALIWSFDITVSHAHCDTLDGPVVSEARTAIQNRDVTPVLKWIPADDEKQVRELFAQTLSVRALSPRAQTLADQHFFETLVRLHRAGEGMPYTGLEPAGAVQPGIALADHALAEGSVDAVIHDVDRGIDEGIRHRFAAVVAAKKHADESVTEGRAYVAAYVEYIHYVEAVNALASGAVQHDADRHGAATHEHEGERHGGEKGPATSRD